MNRRLHADLTGPTVEKQVRRTKMIRKVLLDRMHARILHLESNAHFEWSEFERYQSPDPYDDSGWFHVTVGATGVDGGNDFQVCVATPRAVGRIKRSGPVPGILVDHFDATSVSKAIYDRVTTVKGHCWEQIVEQLREFMLWELRRNGWFVKRHLA